MLFLADVDHANCAKIELTRRYPPTGRRAFPNVGVVAECNRKRNGGSEIQSRRLRIMCVTIWLLYDGFFSLPSRGNKLFSFPQF